MRNGVLDPTPVAGLPQRPGGRARRADGHRAPSAVRGNKLVYFTYHKPQAAPGAPAPAAGPGPADAARAAGRRHHARARTMGRRRLVDAKDIFTAIPSGNASRIVFGRDGMVYMSIGYGDPPASATPIRPACRRRIR